MDKHLSISYEEFQKSIAYREEEEKLREDILRVLKILVINSPRFYLNLGSWTVSLTTETSEIYVFRCEDNIGKDLGITYIDENCDLINPKGYLFPWESGKCRDLFELVIPQIPMIQISSDKDLDFLRAYKNLGESFLNSIGDNILRFLEEEQKCSPVIVADIIINNYCK